MSKKWGQRGGHGSRMQWLTHHQLHPHRHNPHALPPNYRRHVWQRPHLHPQQYQVVLDLQRWYYIHPMSLRPLLGPQTCPLTWGHQHPRPSSWEEFITKNQASRTLEFQPNYDVPTNVGSSASTEICLCHGESRGLCSSTPPPPTFIILFIYFIISSRGGPWDITRWDRSRGWVKGSHSKTFYTQNLANHRIPLVA